jgi:hypothetical protein
LELISAGTSRLGYASSRVSAGRSVFSSLVYLAYWAFGLVVPDYPGAVTIVASLPILVAEVSTGLWLLTRGIKIPLTAD